MVSMIQRENGQSTIPSDCWPDLPLKSMKRAVKPLETCYEDVLVEHDSAYTAPTSTYYPSAPFSASSVSYNSKGSFTSYKPVIELGLGAIVEEDEHYLAPLPFSGVEENGIPTHSGCYNTESPNGSFSDPEGDDSSDSGSEVSLSDFSFSRPYSPFTDLADDDEFLLPPLLLFSENFPTEECSPVKAVPSTFKDVLSAHVPGDLREVMDDVCVFHDPFARSLQIIVGRASDGQENDNTYSRSWSKNHISNISITMSELTNAGVSTVEKRYQFLFWALGWAHINYGNSIEEASISIPESFPRTKEISFTLDDVDTFPAMHTLTWSGDARILYSLLPRIASSSALHILNIRSTLGMADALALMPLISDFQLFALELGTITDSASAPPTRSPPALLPYLDTLKIASAVPLAPLWAALRLPALCKCELDLRAAGARGEEVLRTLAASALLDEHTLFVDAELAGQFVGMDKVMDLLTAQAPCAYVSFRGALVGK